MADRIGISMRTALALAVAVLLLPLLVFVELPRSDAGAHPRTTQRCDYDPISGQNFNCRTVSVRHYHSPVQRTLCPPGTQGTYPNCTRPDTPAEAETKKPKPTATTAAPPPTTKAPPPPTTKAPP
ncbi:MAG: hypothetical protein F4Y66_01665, partial [Acidimicrobiales bacterium]|nr:hypothetical protein [Acidimicrobiales bacterium]